MSNLLNKSIQLRRFHVAILIIIASLCAWGITRYTEMIQTRLNRVVFSTSILNIQNMLASNGLLKRDSGPTCHFLDNPDLFKTDSVPVLKTVSSHKNSQTGVWHYEATRRRLVFRLKPSQYFQSSIGSQIWVDFICKKGSITINVSPHQWCQEMRLWGCISY